ncbi:tyrosine-type recombinase/integrase [Pseudomonas sp. NMI795_08]|uniref:tyrosine-type recombinase/integrase n=1 Tax=Pseudomonas sp. NMI795_08 TaxID=2903144 RepID=UPI001E3B7F84|nr:tyrosine-type recombinase/integrase [Pseudomonas sp. NMI795_08]MCE1119133.1 tyrosine-type recombinase/integrase [Pseudomonas sp. NMI795_08]
MTDSKTQHIKFNDAELKRLAEVPVIRNVRDHRHPALLFRFGRNRARGSWLVVRHVNGKSPTRKLGNWPDIPAKTALELLPKKLAELTTDPDSIVGESGWVTLGDLLRWHLDRVTRDRSKSEDWKANVRSLIACQLLPRVGSLHLAQVKKATIDDQLIWPMQEVRSLAYTRQAFGLVKTALSRAVKLELLKASPLSEMVFKDSIDTPIRPKPCAIRPLQLPPLLARLCTEGAMLTALCMLPLLMLCHGTRISETRLAKWTNIELVEGGEWYFPPEDTKTDQALRLPLTRFTLALLKAYRAQQKRTGYTGIYLFPRGDGEPLTDNQGQALIASLAGGEWTSHDLRKIARTLWLDLGVDYFIGELLLNHDIPDLQAAYIHTHAEALKRDALERWHTWLESRGLPFFATATGPRHAAIGTDPHANNHAG